MKTSNWIELPRDEYGNRGYTNSQAQVIRANVEPGTGKPGTYGGVNRLHILEPEWFREKWPAVYEHDMAGGYWVEINSPAGFITEKEYAALVDGVADIPEFMKEAARCRADVS